MTKTGSGRAVLCLAGWLSLGMAADGDRPELKKMEAKDTAGAKVQPAMKVASAVLEPRSGSLMTGRVVFAELNGKVTLTIEVENAPPGVHAVHLHEKGDCGAQDASSAGGHWNPTEESHGRWGIRPFHRGDIGNLEVGPDGTGSLTLESDSWVIDGYPAMDVVGKSVIVHAKEDDFATQPTGNAGGRIACGVVRFSRED